MPYLVLILSLVQPVLALPLAMYISIKKHSSTIGVFCIALAFATLAFTAIPPDTYDLARHYSRIQSLRGLPLKNVIESSGMGYYLFDTYAWLLNRLNLPKELFPASVIFVLYYLVFSVYNDVKVSFLQNSKPLYIVLVFLGFWLSISYAGSLSGLRNPLANVIIFYLTYRLFFYNNKLLFILGSLLAFFIHPFSIAPAILVYLAYRLSPWFKHARWLIVIGILLSLSTKLISIGIDYISTFLMRFSFYSAAYFDENSEVGGASIESRTLNGLIINVILPRLSIFIAQIYLLTFKSKKNDPLYLLLAMTSLYLGFFASYGVLYGRMAAFFLFIFILFISLEYTKSKNSRAILIAYVGLLILISLIALFIQYPVFIGSSFPEAIYKPVLFIVFGI